MGLLRSRERDCFGVGKVIIHEPAYLSLSLHRWDGLIPQPGEPYTYKLKYILWAQWPCCTYWPSGPSNNSETIEVRSTRVTSLSHLRLLLSSYIASLFHRLLVVDGGESVLEEGCGEIRRLVTCS